MKPPATSGSSKGNPLGPLCERGFSLLELLVAAAVFSLLVILLSQIISPTMEVVGQGRRYFELHSKARAALDLISRDLSQGIYRPDVPTFQDDQTNAALAFFTRRSGRIDPNDTPDSYRQLSYVLYRAEESSGTNFHLWRGAINLRWDATNGAYPAVSGLSGPMPFATQTIAAAYPEASNTNSGTFEPVLKGVARMEVRFLGTDGQYRRTFNNDPASDPVSNPISKAATITLLVMDERTQDLIMQTPGVLETFRQNFIDPSGKLKSPPESDTALGIQWEQALNEPSTWDGLPVRVRGSIHAFERTVPLR